MIDGPKRSQESFNSHNLTGLGIMKIEDAKERQTEKSKWSFVSLQMCVPLSGTSEMSVQMVSFILNTMLILIELYLVKY